MDRPSDEDLNEFVGRTEEAAAAWVRGDLDRYLDLVHHARGFTLLAPTGGPASRHGDRTGELRGWESSFAGGEATLEHVMTHAWGDTVVLVMTERQHGRIGDQPDQDLRYASPTSTGVQAPTGCWFIGTRILWSRRCRPRS